MRSATPEGVQDEYWLELYPKRIQDARTYSKIELVIARKDFLPSAMHLYSANYAKRTQPANPGIRTEKIDTLRHINEKFSGTPNFYVCPLKYPHFVLYLIRRKIHAPRLAQRHER